MLFVPLEPKCVIRVHVFFCVFGCFRVYRIGNNETKQKGHNKYYFFIEKKNAKVKLNRKAFVVKLK